MTGRRRWDDQAAALVSWPGLARPPTPGGADTANDVDGRHKPALGRAKGWARGAGHDTGASGPALSAPRRTSRAMTGRCARCVSTKPRLAVEHVQVDWKADAVPPCGVIASGAKQSPGRCGAHGPGA